MVELSVRPGALSSLLHTPQYASTPRRVLIVEDGLDAVRALSALVDDMGHRVEYAINGYAALELAHRFKPDFVLLDLGLPGMSGFELCQALKSDRQLARARVIALTGYGQDEYRAKSKSVGCELHLLKPVSAQALFDLLESSLPAH